MLFEDCSELCRVLCKSTGISGRFCFIVEVIAAIPGFLLSLEGPQFIIGEFFAYPCSIPKVVDDRATYLTRCESLGGYMWSYRPNGCSGYHSCTKRSHWGRLVLLAMIFGGLLGWLLSAGDGGSESLFLVFGCASGNLINEKKSRNMQRNHSIYTVGAGMELTNVARK